MDADKTAIEEVIRRRIEGIRLRNPSLIASAVKVELYTKFDDWTPRLQVGSEALREEDAALKVLSEYSYRLNDLRVEAQGRYAWASFYLNYRGVIRRSRFDAQSRVSIFLLKEDGDWRIVHEHFSIMPTELPTQPIAEGERPKAKPEANLDELGEAVITVLRDGLERSAQEIANAIAEQKGRPVDVSEIVERCRELLARGRIEQTRGGIYPKYKIAMKSDDQA